MANTTTTNNNRKRASSRRSATSKSSNTPSSASAVPVNVNDAESSSSSTSAAAMIVVGVTPSPSPPLELHPRGGGSSVPFRGSSSSSTDIDAAYAATTSTTTTTTTGDVELLDKDSKLPAMACMASSSNSNGKRKLRSSSSNTSSGNSISTSTTSSMKSSSVIISKRAKSSSSSVSLSSSSLYYEYATTSSSSSPYFAGRKPTLQKQQQQQQRDRNSDIGDNDMRKATASLTSRRRCPERGGGRRKLLMLDSTTGGGGDDDNNSVVVVDGSSMEQATVLLADASSTKEKKLGQEKQSPITTTNSIPRAGSTTSTTTSRTRRSVNNGSSNGANSVNDGNSSYSFPDNEDGTSTTATIPSSSSSSSSGGVIGGNATTTTNNSSQPDGNGGLNQPSPSWIVEYSKTGRATCRSCDEKIAKGDIRIGHTPLFRGKPGYMVYRHLHCTIFSEEIQSATDVENYDVLRTTTKTKMKKGGDDDDDYAKLVEQVRISQTKIHEEYAELHPDELVQTSFHNSSGSMRYEQPRGLHATLLPFQVEGYSWMYHQEVNQVDVRGGILADEMGMGKTIQTIATILDHRPKLQHTQPGMKHPPSANDIKERLEEDQLWDKAKVDWTAEMELLKVPKKFIRSTHGGGSGGGGGARAGTLVICPVIALMQWKTEIEKFTEDGSLTVCIYHGPDRASQTPRDLMRKYDVVLTTYQVLEADFRKMTSPNRVECPNCGGKFKIDKLPIHLKYFCGETAERTEAQARQRRNSDRDGDNSRRGRSIRTEESNSENESDAKKMGKKKQMIKVKTTPKVKVPTAKMSSKKAGPKSTPPKLSNGADRNAAVTPRSGSQRKAALSAASKISRSAADWIANDDDDDKSDSHPESSSDDEGDDDSIDSSSSSSSDDSALVRAREKQRQALEMSKTKKMRMTKKKDQPAASKSKGKQVPTKKKAGQPKGKKKKFDDESTSSSESSDDDIDGDDEIDMEALVEKAMAGAKNSVLHSLCWWRIILDEAHFIKTRSSQTANAAFSLIGCHRWCLSGTPLQNRVGEFYSLVRFLRLDPMGYYYCRVKDCTCKSMHYRMLAGICECCGHGGIQHYSHFNKYILNPIQRDGYSGDGRRAMFLLKNEVLDKAMLRRTKESRAADMELPPRLVQIKPVRLHPVEEDFYSALYTQTKTSFDSFVDSGTLLNNYAHIFDLLIRMRQSVDHPYLVIHSKKNVGGQESLSRQVHEDCELCHEPPTDRVVSTCCSSTFCRACVMEYMATSSGISSSASLACPSCNGAFSIDLQSNADVEDDSSLNVTLGPKSSNGISSGMPSLKELQHVATGSILRRINLAEFATSSKIEALTRELVMMRQSSPGSKAIVFSQFVNMLDLIRWRLHSDPYLEDIGLGCRALHGGMNVKARDDCLREFREDNNVRVLLMSLKAGGVALNLTCANHIFLMDPWWNPAAEMQAIDRTHRLGQYRPIRAVRFIAENTVEERILQLQEKKRLVFDGTVGRDAASLTMLSVDDMKNLFS